MLYSFGGYYIPTCAIGYREGSDKNICAQDYNCALHVCTGRQRGPPVRGAGYELVTAQQSAESRDLRHREDARTADTKERGDMREYTKIQREHEKESMSFETLHSTVVTSYTAHTTAQVCDAPRQVTGSPNRTGSSLARIEHRQSDTLPNAITQHADTQTASPTVGPQPPVKAWLPFTSRRRPRRFTR
ncbi:hypothetical protein CERZMDRAFT_89114 [Cercospora zeae-maydis SCOH1-5]|uniref:Uncharacterized protein n=1 Tax=Cercospora zeae-maydis SCOH1-5 TaxID=717836 RepID=A0A6A6F307_9PEZI|nr:hypothetical protein CERZMDRAFT_89114 [Cercospora zeae-maydis SCOH1-5]